MITADKTTMPDLYDPLCHTPCDDLYEIYARLRTAYPVYFNARRGVWCLTRYADVQNAARSWGAFSSLPGGDLDEPGFYGPGNFLDDDPPRHDVLRDVIRPFFVPKAIASLREAIERRVDVLISELREKQTADLAADFAVRLPIWVICRLLGAPEADDDLIQRLVLQVETKVPGDDTMSVESAKALKELKAYLADLAEQKKRRPDDKVLSRMVAGVARGAPTADEVVGMAGILFSAGSETTFALLGNALNLFAQFPDVSQAIRRDDSGDVISGALEEALRFEAPVQYLARTVTEDTTLRGMELKAGDRVILVYGAANRDAERWSNPEQFDIARPQKRHLGFGEGIHFCIGAPLARLEAGIALPAFLRAFEEYEILTRKRRNHHIVRGWERLEATLVTSRSTPTG